VEIAAADERRHGDVRLAETWWFDLADPDSGRGAVVRLALRPADRVAWWWVAVVGCGPSLVALRAHDVPIPPRGTDIRTDGLWASMQCETPLEHWSVGVECFGVAYDDPWDALRGERGDLVPLGLDLEWEAEAPATPRPDGNGYGQWCSVTGEILLGDDRIDVTAIGHREHAWGPAAELPARSVRIRTGDGRRLWGGDAWMVDGPGTPIEAPPATEAETGVETATETATETASEVEVAVTDVAVCPFAVPGRPWVETLCRAEGGGGGWLGGVYTRS
jgi:hypothetical protein